MKPSALKFLKSSRLRIRWNLNQIYKVTSWKSGCVYGTRTLGYVVCSPEYREIIRNKSIQIVPPSTSITSQL